MTSLSLAGGTPTSVKADALVIAVAKGPKGPVLVPPADEVGSALGKGFAAALAGLGATGKAEEVTRIANIGGTGPAVVVAVGVGAQGDADVARQDAHAHMLANR